MVLLKKKGSKASPSPSSKKETGTKGTGRFRVPTMAILENQYQGPSGYSYVLGNQRYGDKVTNEEDLEYFRSNARFEEEKE